MSLRQALLLPLLAFAACAHAAKQSPLTRRYQEGDVLRYQFSGTHFEQGKQDLTWSAQAGATVVKDSSGVFHEEIQWTRLQENGKDVAVPPELAGFRQKLSLDPRFGNSIPDLSKIIPNLISPITDTLTFYSGDVLALKHGLAKAGDHAYVKYGKPSSWADGSHVVEGYDCIDFDVTLAELDAAKKTATLKVKYVPPPEGCARYPVEWMRKPVFDTANNWLEVTKEGEGRYRADVGKEVFDADIKIELPTGVILSAALYNPVDAQARTCKDAKLSDCGAPEKLEIVRKISLTLDRQ